MTSDPHSSDSNGGAPADAQADTQKNPDSAPPEAEIEALKAERKAMHDKWLRAEAELQNVRKRGARDLEDAKARGRDNVIRELLPVFDTLERAVQSSAAASDVKSVIEGVRMVLKMFEDTAARVGLARVKTVGERFDPNEHEAVQQVESADHPPGTIVAEIAAGYRSGERLVRPAMVVVARKSAESKPAPRPEAAAADAGSAAAAEPAAGTAGQTSAGASAAAERDKSKDAPSSVGGDSPASGEPPGKSGTDKPE